MYCCQWRYTNKIYSVIIDIATVPVIIIVLVLILVTRSDYSLGEEQVEIQQRSN